MFDITVGQQSCDAGHSALGFDSISIRYIIPHLLLNLCSN